VLAQRWRGGGGEIDLAALDGEVLVFVEVKMRSAGGSPEEAVSAAKQARVRSAAEAFIAAFGLEGRQARFDVAAWEGGRLRWTRDAF
jgi:putative endonuclease